jgi:hypothetical protein
MVGNPFKANLRPRATRRAAELLSNLSGPEPPREEAALPAVGGNIEVSESSGGLATPPAHPATHAPTPIQRKSLRSGGVTTPKLSAIGTATKTLSEHIRARYVFQAETALHECLAVWVDELVVTIFQFPMMEF